MPFLILSLLLLVSFSAAQPQGPAFKEYETSDALARISFIDAPLPADDSISVTPAAGVESIDDFASLASIDRDHDALLEAYLIDKHSGTELRFPLKYSQLRDHLLLHPLDYQEGTREARNIALLEAMAETLHVRMMDGSAPEEKQ